MSTSHSMYRTHFGRVGVTGSVGATRTCTCTCLKGAYCAIFQLSLVPRPLPKEGRRSGIHCLRMREMFLYTIVKLFGERPSSMYEIENALQDLRISSGHTTFNGPFFCPWHEPGLAYMHKRATFFPTLERA